MYRKGNTSQNPHTLCNSAAGGDCEDTGGGENEGNESAFFDFAALVGGVGVSGAHLIGVVADNMAENILGKKLRDADDGGTFLFHWYGLLFEFSTGADARHLFFCRGSGICPASPGEIGSFFVFLFAKKLLYLFCEKLFLLVGQS
jgi:hypothetical protein